MIRDCSIHGAVAKNSLPVSAEIAASNDLEQGSVAVLNTTTGAVTRPADLAAAQAAEYIVINADSGKEQYDTYVENFTGTALKYLAGAFVRLFELRTLVGFDGITVSAAIVDAAAVAGNTLIPLYTGGWEVNATITGYAYYFKVREVTVNEQGNLYHCTVVAA